VSTTPVATTGPSELRIRVRSDATVCLDLVLDHAGVAHRDVELWPDGASVVVDVADHTEGERIVAVLRQHLGVVLRSAVILHDGRNACVLHEPTARDQRESRDERDAMRDSQADPTATRSKRRTRRLG